MLFLTFESTGAKTQPTSGATFVLECAGFAHDVQSCL